MVLRWFSSLEEVFSRLVAIKLPCRPLWRTAKGTVRQCSLNWSRGMAQQCLLKSFGANMFRVLSRSRCNINGSFVHHSLGLPLVFVLKAMQDIVLNLVKLSLVSSKRGFGSGRKRPYILAKTRSTCWHEDHTDTLSGNIFGKTDFFPQHSTQSVQTLLANCFPTHTKKTQMTVIEHLHKLANTGMRYAAVSPVTDRKRASLTADNATISYRKVEFTTEKENYPW